MRVLILSILTILSLQWAFTQNFRSEECGVAYAADPRFDRAEYERFKDNYLSRTSNEVKMVPIVARIVRRSDGTGGLDPEVLGGIIDTLNVRFKGANMEFFMCGDPEFVDVNAFYDFDRSIYADSLVSYNIPNVVNIYFINKILNDDVFLCGYASFPWFNQEYVVVKNECALNGSTLAHEFGHYLGLYHTHETFNGTELVDGSNCLFTGDELCDTPADPRLGGFNVDADCNYTGTQRDAAGKLYQPDPSNLMSYSLKSCRDYFSPEQHARMNFYLERDRSHLACSLATQITQTPDFEIRTFPNPVNSQLNVSLSMTEPNQLKLTLLDLEGRALGTWEKMFTKGDQTFDLPMSHLSTGVYVLHIEGNDGNAYMKIVKQ